MDTQTGTLYVVPTPIGNLEDMTPRAITVLNHVSVVACEDTRVSGQLFAHFGITARKVSYHDHNERGRTPELLVRLQSGDDVALVSDAGTPGVSDPGFFLVRAAIELGIPVDVLPGANALLPALVGSGLPCDRFVFEGFLPTKKGRQTRLRALAEETRTIVIYESPHRVVRTLAELQEIVGPERSVCVCRELTKKFQEYIRGEISAVHDVLLAREKIKGECVIVVAGADAKTRSRRTADDDPTH